jgi:glycine/D-amino acid oxidase-like deaminating enzyme
LNAAEPDEVIIVGASLVGLCAAWQLRKKGVERITVLEKRRFGHRKGASHGRSRALSCAGFDEPLLGLLMLAREQGWPELQAALGKQVFTPAPGLVVGPLTDAFNKRATEFFGMPDLVKPIPLGKARSEWPTLKLEAGTGTAADASALLIAAEVATDALMSWLQNNGVQLVPNTEVKSVHSTADGLWLETSRGRFMSERVICTAGYGTKDLFNRSESRIKSRKVVSAFFKVDAPEAMWRVGKFPVVRGLGEGGHPEWTVSPEFADRGIKVTRHSCEGGLEDDYGLGAMRAWFQDALGVRITEQLGREVRRVVHVSDRPLIADTHHDDPRIVFAAGFNGQEVSVAPILGKALAELVLDGRSGIAAFQRNRKYFALPRRGLPTRRKRKPSQGVKF